MSISRDEYLAAKRVELVATARRILRGYLGSIAGVATFRLGLIISSLATAQNALAHDLFDQWDADVTPNLCLVAGESGLVYDEEHNSYEPGPVTARIAIGRFHVGAENTLARIEGLEIEPLFINLQIITSLSLRADGVTVAKTVVTLGDDEVTPILDAEWGHEDLPVSYLGGNEASRFAAMLEQGESPIVSVRLSNSETIDVPVSQRGFEVAREMMRTCVKESAKLKIDQAA